MDAFLYSEMANYILDGYQKTQDYDSIADWKLPIRARRVAGPFVRYKEKSVLIWEAC